MERITSSNDGSLLAPYGTIANAIRKLREKRGWTQVQLARRINRDQSSVASHESGRICPSVRVTQQLAMEFNCSVEFLLSHRRTLFEKMPSPQKGM